MRYPPRSPVLLALAGCAAVLAGACGPSAAEIKRARTASYTCDRDTVIQAVVAEVEARQPPLAAVDGDRGIVLSEFRWHDRDGLRKKKGSAEVREGDVMFSVAAGIQPQGRGWVVLVVPRVLLHVTGSPRGKELIKGDPEWPDWADGKADILYVALHKRLGACAVAE